MEIDKHINMQNLKIEGVKEMWKKSKWLCTAILATATFSFMFGNTTEAENALDPAPILTPVQSNGYSVLFDNSHGQTAGQSDWVIDGAFSDFADALVDEGYIVEEFRSVDPLTLNDLLNYDVFVIPEAQIPFTASEQAAISSYAELGGGVFFIADHYNADRNLNRWDSNEIMNGWRRGAYLNPTLGMSSAEAAALNGVVSSRWLSDEFGVEFRYNSIDNTVANQIVAPSQSFGITTGISQVSIHAGSTIAITNPSIAKGIAYLPTGLTSAANKWSNSVDQGVYAGGGIAEGPFVAIGKKELGKAAFIGDSSPVEDATPKYRNEETGSVKRTYDGFTAHNNGELLVNIINWLATDETYTTFNGTAITLDQVTPRISIEDPLLSSEILNEPWRQPNAGYLWYDSSTFANGSYGSTVDPTPSVTYSAVTPDVLPVDGSAFNVTVTVEGLAPNSTIQGHRIQIYLTGGTAISQVRNDNGTWPTGYGYFDIGTLTANSQGTAQKTITMRLNSNVTATEGTLRLKDADGNNVITKAVVLGEGTGNEGPPEDPQQEIEIGNYKLILPQVLPTHGEEFKIGVEIKGLTAGATISNAQLQFYLTGGTSISQVKNSNGTWPTSYGYGNVGTLTANAQGIAVGEVTVRINPTVTSTTATVRLRLGSSNNVLTAPISLQ